MPPDSSESEFEHLIAEVRLAAAAVRHAHFRLVWVAGRTSRERSQRLEAVAANLGCPCLNIGRSLSASLLEFSPRLRAASAEDTFLDLLTSAASDIICLDHIEVLFDPALRLSAVDLIQNASRRFVLVASWPGEIDGTGLSFGPADHPAHARICLPMAAIPVIFLS
jgi:hypothetical protein